MNKELQAAWQKRDKLWTENNKLRAEGDKLRAEGDKLRAEGDKLRAEGSILWAEAIIKVYGHLRLKWFWDVPGGRCVLENGEEYGAVTAAENR